MKRIDHPSAAIDNAGNKVFTAGNPQLGIPATKMTAEWATVIQEELANALEKNGIQLSAADNGQLFALLRKQERPPMGIGDFSQFETGGFNATGKPLDIIQTPVGFLVAADVLLNIFLFRGGRGEVIDGFGDDAIWASWCPNGDRFYVCFCSTDGYIYTRYVDAVPHHAKAGAVQVWSYADKMVEVGKSNDVYSNVDPRYDREFIGGRLLDPQHVLFVRHCRHGESGLDYLDAVVRWVQADGLIEATLATLNLPFATWPYVFSAGVDPKARCCCALAPATKDIACVLAHNTVTKLIRGRIDDNAIDLTLTNEVTLALEDTAVTLDTGAKVDRGVRLLWSDAAAAFVAFQPGGTRLFIAPAPSGAVTTLQLQGCKLLDAIDFGGKLVVFARSENGSGIQVGELVAGSIVWHQTVAVRNLDFQLFLQAYLSQASGMQSWRDRRAIVAGDVLLFHAGSLVAGSRNPLYGPWSVVETVDLVNVVGSDGAGRLLAIDRDGYPVVTPAIG